MTEDQACQQAIHMGMYEIAFTNHSMLTEPDYTISQEAFVNHWVQIQACQRNYPELTIRLGLEMDYYEGRENEVRDSIETYESSIGRPFDVILGAVHHLNDLFFSSKEYAIELFQKYEIAPLYHDYFALATKAVQSGLFDVMAHPDLIKKFMGELSPCVPFEQYSQAAEAYADALIACDVGIEVNTKRFKERGRECFPSEELLKLYISKAKAQGKEPVITLGSDAHKVSDVGKYVIDGAKILQKMGHNAIASFVKRKSFSCPL
jgi:histidinol-phosphatase (PHP family)